jgi:cell division control protein 7
MEWDISEIRDYMKNLLISLDRVHKFNIIHRDIKPSNFLYDRHRNTYVVFCCIFRIFPTLN